MGPPWRSPLGCLRTAKIALTYCRRQGCTNMPSLQQIANHLGISKNAATQQMAKLGLAYKTMALDEIARAYMDRQRAIASGHVATFTNGEQDLDLMQERAKKERCERELLQMKLDKRKLEVLNISQHKYLWTYWDANIKKHLYQADKEIIKQTKKRYGITLDIAVIHSFSDDALRHLEP